MAFRIGHDCESPELIAEFPLSPINDDHAYSRAIAILDHLFESGDQRTPAETEYFHALAKLACEYEEASIKKKGVRNL
jgi:antitoxin component HigA of HigAB toxin-antitoxin module